MVCEKLRIAKINFKQTWDNGKILSNESKIEKVHFLHLSKHMSNRSYFNFVKTTHLSMKTQVDKKWIEDKNLLRHMLFITCVQW